MFSDCMFIIALLLFFFFPQAYWVIFDKCVDPEYLEFLEFIAKPVENLPSAEIQLERKEAERAGQS